MTDRNAGKDTRQEGTGARKNVDRLDQDLDIMERHSGELAQAEEDIQDDMRRRDREFKDSRLHSVPKSRKHVR